MPRHKFPASLSKSPGIRRKPMLECLEPRCLLAAIAMSDDEQLMIELINRARVDPLAEAARLGLDAVTTATISATPKPPLAPNPLLIGAAGAHSQDMIDRNFFDHVNPSGEDPGDRIAKVGYPARAWAENIALHVDASAAHDALFRSAGHRANMLSSTYRELGIGVRNRDTWGVNVTELFATRLGNPFLTGVAFSDQILADDFFTVGEGLDGVTISATSRTSGVSYTTSTGPSGGYSLQVPSGMYDLTASGGELASPLQIGGVMVGTMNVKVDFVPSPIDPRPPVATDDRALVEKDSEVVIDVLQNDSGGFLQNSPVIEVVSSPSRGQVAVDASTGRFTYSPQLGQTGLDEFHYRVQGAGGDWSPVACVRVTVVDLADRPWRNPDRATDVNADGRVTALDALLLIGHLNGNQPHTLPVPSAQAEFPPAYWDVTGEGIVDALDVLAVINRMNWSAEGEGEASSAEDGGTVAPLPAPTPAALAASGTTRDSSADAPDPVSANDTPRWPAAPSERHATSATADLRRRLDVADQSRPADDDLLDDGLAPLLDVLVEA